jgi:CHAD domain-containing protein
MLKKGIQKKYFDKRWNSLFCHLTAFSDSQNPEELHKVRIEIKRISALFDFIVSCMEGIQLSDHYNPLRPIYKLAEPVRNAQIYLQIIDTYKLNEIEFRKEQNGELLAQARHFNINYNQYISKIQDVYYFYSDLISNIEEKPVIKFYKKNINKIVGFLSDDNVESKLHDCRKRIKQLIYVYEILPENILKKLNADISGLVKLDEYIGKWHDIVSIYDLINGRINKNRETILKLEDLRKKEMFNINSLSYNFILKAKI